MDWLQRFTADSRERGGDAVGRAHFLGREEHLSQVRELSVMEARKQKASHFKEARRRTTLQLYEAQDRSTCLVRFHLPFSGALPADLLWGY